VQYVVGTAQPGPHGELNYIGGKDKFFQSGESCPLGEFSRKTFYKDGRFRETTFIVESLLRSACFKISDLPHLFCLITPWRVLREKPFASALPE
jgi:hypothetical protein